MRACPGCWTVSGWRGEPAPLLGVSDTFRASFSGCEGHPPLAGGAGRIPAAGSDPQSFPCRRGAGRPARLIGRAGLHQSDCDFLGHTAPLGRRLLSEPLQQVWRKPDPKLRLATSHLTLHCNDAPSVTEIDAPSVIEVNRKVRHRCVMAREDPHFRLRLPADLKARVEAAARDANRSINAEIVAALEERYPAPREPEPDLETLPLAVWGPRLIKLALRAGDADQAVVTRALIDHALELEPNMPVGRFLDRLDEFRARLSARHKAP
jgi:hypothetical protein